MPSSSSSIPSPSSPPPPPLFPVIPKENLKNLLAYQCNGADLSLVRTYILNPFYEFLMKFVPTYVAANTITLIGVSFVFLSAALCAIYSPTIGDMDVPGWVFLMNALFIFTYQTLDNLDGKQARRTKMSSPLGELFDHGCDALSCTYGGMCWVIACGQGGTINTFFIYCIAYATFIFATWEEYFACGMYFGYFNGPTEGILMIIGSQIVAGIYGVTIYQQSLSDIIGFQVPILGRCPLWLVVNIFALVVTILTIVNNVRNVYRITSDQKNANDEDRNSFTKALAGLIPFAILFGGSMLWIISSPENVFLNHPYFFLVTFGFVFAFFGSNMTLSYLVRTPLKRFHFLSLAPLILCVLNSFYGRFMGRVVVSEFHTLLVWFMCSLCVYSNFVHSCIYQISTFLKIPVFTVTPLSEVQNKK